MKGLQTLRQHYRAQGAKGKLAFGCLYLIVALLLCALALTLVGYLGIPAAILLAVVFYLWAGARNFVLDRFPRLQQVPGFRGGDPRNMALATLAYLVPVSLVALLFLTSTRQGVGTTRREQATATALRETIASQRATMMAQPTNTPAFVPSATPTIKPTPPPPTSTPVPTVDVAAIQTASAATVVARMALDLTATAAAIPTDTPIATPTPPPKPTATPTATEIPTKTPVPPTATPRPTETPTPGLVTVRVVRVIDGDTIEIEGGQRVRYIGMDTPERGDPFFDEATEANRQLVEGQTIRLEKDVSETDRYGRLLRYVYVGDLMVNAELVRQGYAQVATFPPDVKYQDLFLRLQQEAREAGRGLWAPTPTATTRPTDTPRPAPTQTPRPTNTPVPPTTATPPPTGRGNIQITFIFYDGVVPRVESDEYVEIVNQGNAAQDLTGWRLVSLQGNQVFHFPPGFIMQSGQTCRVYTNEVHPETCGLSFGSGQAVWNNKGDTAVLYDAGGNEVSRYGY